MMKYTIICTILLTLSSFKDSPSNSNLEIKAILLNKYATGSCLIELKLVNKSTIPVTFLTMSCATGENLVLDKNYFEMLIPICSHNRIIPITLNFNQEFSYFFVIRPIWKIQESIRIGWILLNESNVRHIDDYSEVVIKSRKKLQNIIWAPTLSLDGGQPIEIK